MARNLRPSFALFNRQGDIILMEISLLIFYEKRQSLIMVHEAVIWFWEAGLKR